MSKGFSIHSLRLGTLTSFLNKCGKAVKIAVGEGKTYAIDQVISSTGELVDGAVLVWSQHHKFHERYRFIGTKQDRLVLMTPKDLVLKALKQVRLEMQGVNKDKIRIVYNGGFLRFLSGVSKEVVKSVEVPVRVVSDALEETHKEGGDFKVNANGQQLIELFSSSRSNEVEFRVTVSEQGKKAFRTMESFYLNDSGKLEVSPETAKEPCHECHVTRFMMAMD
jgi:hypothetical protein